jgi:putative Holliday junction resolvase
MGVSITALGFDFGMTSIGVAYGQSLTQTAKPLSTIKARDGIPDWSSMARLVDEWQPHYLIVGLPLNMDDSESQSSLRARKFANRLQARFGLPVELMDERLTSYAVKEEAKSRGHSGDYKKEPVDSLAAQMILEDWFRQAQ